MSTQERHRRSIPLLVITITTLAALTWCPGWLPFATVALGAAWYSTSPSQFPKSSVAILLCLMVLAIVASGYNAGKALALRDNARADARL